MAVHVGVRGPGHLSRTGAASSGTTSFARLLEDGTPRVLEDGTPRVLEGAPAATMLAPGAGWDGTLGSGGTPTAVTRATASPWLTEMFQNWDTITTPTRFGFDSWAGGLVSAGVEGVSHIDWYLNSSTVLATSTAEEWVNYTDPNRKVWPEFGWFTPLIDTAAILARATALGVSKPQVALWGMSYPRDPSMQPRLMGPYTINVRSTRFDGTVNVGPSQTVKSFADICKYKHDNGIERLNAIFVENANILMNAAVSPNTLTEIVTTGVYGITLTAAQTSTLVGSISGSTLTVTAVTGAIGIGDSLCGDVILPNVVIGSQLTGSTGSTGTYALTVTSPDDSLPGGGYSIAPGAAFKTTKTAILGDGTVAQFAPGFDGVRIEGAGVKTDICQIGYQVSSAVNIGSNSYGAWAWVGCESFMGVPNQNGGVTRTGSGSSTMITGQTPQTSWTTPTIFNPKASATVVPGGTGESTIGWWTFIATYHHDSYSGYNTSRVAKHVTTQRLPQPTLQAYRTAHNITAWNTSAVAAGLRVFKNAWVIHYAGGNSSPTVQTTATGNGQPGSLVLTTSGDSFSIPYTSTTTLQNVFDAINDATSGKPGAAGWSAPTFQDTTGRSAIYMSISTIVPSAHIPVTAVDLTIGLQMGSILDVHGDILTQLIPNSTVTVIDNRAARFVKAYGTVGAAPLLLGGNSATFVSSTQDCGWRNCVSQDVTIAVTGSSAGLTPTNIGNVCSHIYFCDNTQVDVPASLGCASLSLDAYSKLKRNALDNFAWSAGTGGTSPFTASFDGSTIMTVTAVRQNGTLYNSGVYPGQVLANGAVVVAQLTQVVDLNGVTGPNRLGTYQMDRTVTTAAAAAIVVNSINIGADISDNVMRTNSSVLANSLGSNSKALNSAFTDAQLYNSPSTLDFSPVAAGQLQMANAAYAGALNPDGSWKLVT